MIRLSAIASRLFVFALFAVSCDEMTQPNRIEKVTTATSYIPPHIVTYDDQLRSIEAALPGFGGLYVDDDGMLVVNMTRNAEKSEIRSAIAPLMATILLPGNAADTKREQMLAGMRLDIVEYDFSQLHHWYQVVSPRILRFGGVSFSDIDERADRIVFGIYDEGIRDDLIGVISDLGIPADVVLIQTVPEASTAQLTLRDKARPVYGGLQIKSTQCGSEDAFTLGVNVAHRYPSGQLDPAEYFVTAAHCTPEFGAVTGGQGGLAYQATFSDSIGREVADPPVFYNATNSNCPLTRACRYSDAALFRYLIPDWAHALVAWPASTGSINYSSTKTIMWGGSSYQGETVYKVGRTSGLGVGTVTQTCANVAMITAGTDTGVTLLCQTRSTLTVQFGDSGSPVFRMEGDGTLVDLGIAWFTDGTFSERYYWNQELSAVMTGGLGSTSSAR